MDNPEAQFSGSMRVPTTASETLTNRAAFPQTLDKDSIGIVMARAAELPVFIQNYGTPVGTPMSARFMADLVQQIDGVEYVKEETAVAAHVMTELLAVAGPRLKGIMGGMAGRLDVR